MTYRKPICLVLFILIMFACFCFSGAGGSCGQNSSSGIEHTSVRTFEIADGVTLDMVYLEGGSFQMGQTDADKTLLVDAVGAEESLKHFESELPRHAVTLDAFWIGKYPVTQAQYLAVMETNPALFKVDSSPEENEALKRRPVEMISWHDAIEFCRRLSQETGYTFTLPTEAQWEYAARAGSSTVFSFGDKSQSLQEYAWYGRNSGDRKWDDGWDMSMNIRNNCRTHPVGMKKPNAWGLNDIHGNVWEWCLDWYNDDTYSKTERINPEGTETGEFRVFRGGSFLSMAHFCRLAYRGRYQPDSFSNSIGFRVVKLPADSNSESNPNSDSAQTGKNSNNDKNQSELTETPVERVRPEEDNRTVVARRTMVETQIARRGIRNELVLESMRNTQRHLFVPNNQVRNAYQDRPLPIGHGQTISQPYIVGLMSELVEPTPKSTVLEIGAGSGYQAAVLAEIVDHVYTIEIVEPLAKWAESRLELAGYTNVTVKHADGYYGWSEHAPFDAIVVTAAAPHIPPPLIEQLKDGGRMIIPVGSPFRTQQLVLVEKKGDDINTRTILPVRFVPFTRSD
jgi:protein-L-isoaspartate(D-aspartate) O-methyltransferase